MLLQFGDVGGPVGLEDEPIVINNANGIRQGVHDALPDPYVPQGDLALALQQSQLRGDQKRWDICTNFPCKLK